MQVTLFIVLFAHNAWMWLLDITGVMISAAVFCECAVFDIVCVASRVCGDAFGEPACGFDNGIAWSGLCSLVALCGRTRISADVNDRVRGRDPGILVCEAGELAKWTGIFWTRKGRGWIAWSGCGRCSGVVRKRHRHGNLNFRMLEVEATKFSTSEV